MSNVSPPSPPIISLGLKLAVTSGYNQIQRNVGSYAAMYLVPNSRIMDMRLNLAVGETYNSNSGETTNNLVVSTNGPLTFSGNRVAGGSILLNVNSALVLDDALSDYSITNNGSSVAIVQMNGVNYTSLAPIDPIYYGAAIAPSNLSPLFVQSLSNSVHNGKNQTVNVMATSGQSIFYCYPLALGTSTFKVNGSSATFNLVDTVTLLVPSGSTQYYVYQSVATGQGAVSLAVSD